MNKLLLIDLGGTNLRYAFSEGGLNDLHGTKKIALDTIPNFDEFISNLLNESGSTKLVISAAGPKIDGTISMTNRDLVVDEKSLQVKHNLDSCFLLNDWESIGYSLSNIEDVEIDYIKQGNPFNGNTFFIGPGTGLGAVLTLPGIAGIVLTIGISVDANVLIFERIREEMAKGKSQKDSIKDGFQNALSSILDANITTGLTGLILLIFGTGPIQGFATTLLIGILTSLFTAIFITRLFIDSFTKNGKPLAFSTPVTKNLFKNVSINFLGKRKIAYVISAVLITVSIGSLITNSLDQGVDFVGGRTYTVRFAQDVDAAAVEQDLIAQFSSAEAKTYGANNQLKITTKYKVGETGSEIDNEVQVKLYDGVKSYLPQGMTFDEFREDNTAKIAGIMEYYKVSPTIADDIKKNSFWAVFGSLFVVFLYILVRFRRWQFSLGAVVAVFHDVLLVLGVFSLTQNIMPFSMEIDQSFIAAILTVIGYSLNDTVVVFDRIREYFNDNPKWAFSKVINSALNSTLSRTLNTSLTTLIVLLCIFFIGAESIRGLIFALMVGVVVGTYSSLFIATPVMYDTVKKKASDLLEVKTQEVEA